MNLIFTSFVYNPEANKAHKIPVDIYLKNICVSLISAKCRNHRDEVSLIVDKYTSELIPQKYIYLLRSNNITIQLIEFNYFLNDNKTTIWNFSLYLLSVIYELSQSGRYEKICSIDSDTYIVKDFSDVWEDSDSYILLCDLNHSHKIQQAVDTYYDLNRLLSVNEYVVNYGGEFIASSCKHLIPFIKEALNIFTSLKKSNIEYVHGVETILALTSKNGSFPIKNASYFCFRYWTGVNFKLLSTNVKYNSVGMYHVPDEKQYGMVTLYKYYLRYNSFPKDATVQSILGLKVRQNLRPIILFKRIINKIKTKY